MGSEMCIRDSEKLLLLLEAWHELRQQEQRRLCVRMPRAISECWDEEELLFLSRLAQPGFCQASQGGLENGMHTHVVSWVVVKSASLSPFGV